MTIRILSILSLLLGLAVVASADDAPATRPGRLDRELRDALVPGLIATFETVHDGRTPTDTRNVRLPALHVPAGARPTPFLPAGTFRAKFAGYLRLKLRGDYAFSFKGRGAVRLRINGDDVMDVPQGDLAVAEPVTVSLVKGHNLLELEYDSPPAGDATLRPYWQGEDFPREPLPTNELTCDGRTEDLATGELLRTGRELVANRLCYRCHQPAVDAWRDDFAGMPELRHDAPSLEDAGNRLEAVWIRHWLRSPTALRNHVTMPDLLHGQAGADVDRDAADLATYVASRQTADAPTAIESTDELRDKGERLYELRGCIACHRFTAPDAEDEFDRVSLHFANAKYRPGALAAFLKNSRAHYEWSRMPKFDLSADEAGALAAYIRSRAEGTLQSPSAAGDAQRGQVRSTELGCVNCHVVGDAVSGAAQTLAASATPFRRPHRPAIDLAKLDDGCLAADVMTRAAAPDYRFTDGERDALAAFLRLEVERQSLNALVPAEFSRRTVKTVNCNACHARDGFDAAYPLLLVEDGELGLLPDQIPNLSWTGEQLKPQWSRQLLAGELGYRLREHFRIRMPAFPERADVLAVGLSHEHGFAADEDVAIPYDAELAKVGREVAAPQTGLSCIRCHPVGELPATAPEQALSPNLSYTRRRVRYEYYHRWMLFPQRIDYNTRMIRFAPDSRLTGLAHLYDGDAERQFDAVWHWLEQLHDEQVAREAKR